MKNIDISKIALYFMLLLSINLVVSCSKYDNPPPVFEDYEKGADTTAERKVLFIEIDAAVPSVLKELQLPVITSMLPHSKYSWEGLSEATTTDPVTWASIATGVRSNKHQIVDESFLPVLTGKTVTNYPTFFNRILVNNSATKTVAISSWEALNNDLLIHASDQITKSNDEEVKDAAIASILDSTKNYSLVSVNFREAATAGKETEFAISSSKYTDELKTIDGYIGEMVGALKERKNYPHENWLVIITSNHSADENDYGGNTAKERSLFAIFYNENYKELELKSNLITSVEMSQHRNVSAAIKDSLAYDFSGSAMTIEAKIKFNLATTNPNEGYKYWRVDMLGKGVRDNRGWTINREDSWLHFSVGDGLNHKNPYFSNFGMDGRWHSFAAKIVKGSNYYYIYLYGDGAFRLKDSLVITPGYNIEAPEVLKIRNGDVNFNIADIKIFNADLREAIIFNDACNFGIDPSHPNYEDLVGWWPCDDGDDLFRNKVLGQPDFNITGPYIYETEGNSLPCNYGNNVQTIENISIAPQVFYWLGINVPDSWLLDGGVFLNKFEGEL